jgi:tripartite-type tricarboxylate transporter receptor subunit TctC
VGTDFGKDHASRILTTRGLMSTQPIARRGVASRRLLLQSLAASAAALGLGGRARAQAPESAQAPERPLAPEPYRVVIAFPPGGTSTASMQPLQEPLREALGAPVELEYKPGAGGNVAALHVIQSKPDGHTLLFGHAGPLAINHHILVQTVFDAQRDLSPLAMVVEYPIVICAAAKLNVKSLPELLVLAQRKQLVVGSSGNGSIQHLAAEIFGRVADIRMVHIPFAGGGPLQQAFERGAIDVLLETGSNIVKHVHAGTLRPLAVMARERLAILPDVPTLAEEGTQDLEVAAWFGLLAPSRTPDLMKRLIAAAALDALSRPDVRAALADIGGLVNPKGPEQFGAFIAQENDRWGRIIRDSGVKPLGTGSRSIGTPQ